MNFKEWVSSEIKVGTGFEIPNFKRADFRKKGQEITVPVSGKKNITVTYDEVKNFAKDAGIKGFSSLSKGTIQDIIKSYVDVKNRYDWLKDIPESERTALLKAEGDFGARLKAEPLFKNIDASSEGASSIFASILGEYRDEWKYIVDNNLTDEFFERLTMNTTSDVILEYDPSEHKYKNAMEKYQSQVQQMIADIYNESVNGLL